MAAKPITGSKVLFIALAAFGVIITANMALVYAAIGSFPGLEVKNTYVASQSFDKDREAQAKLGWSVKTGFADGELKLSITDAEGNPASIGELNATIGRATHSDADVALPFVQSQSPYSLPLALDHGKWEVRISAIATDGTPFRQRLSVIVNP